MKVVKLLHEKKNVLLGFLIAMFVTACSGALMIGAGCDVYSSYRINMPDPVGASRAFLDWLNLLDTEMLRVCKRG